MASRPTLNNEVVEEDEAEYKHYRSKLRIQKTNLDTHFEQHPELFHEISEKCRVLQSQRDLLLFRIKRYESRFYTKTKANTTGRVTKEELSAKIMNEPHWRAMQDDLKELQHHLAKWQTLKESFNQRSQMLRELGRIYVAGYFSDIVIKGSNDLTDETYAQRRVAMSQQRKATKKRKL